VKAVSKPAIKNKLLLLMVLQLIVIVVLQYHSILSRFVPVAVTTYYQDDLPIQINKRKLYRAIRAVVPSTSQSAYILVIYTSPTCGNCLAQAPIMKRLSDNINETDLVGILAGPSNKAELNSFSVKYQIDLPIMPDRDYRLARLLHVANTPSYLLVDHKGTLVSIDANDIARTINNYQIISSNQ